MDANRFDALTRFMATRLTRRATMRGGATGLAATALFGARGAAAQSATPAATPVAGSGPVSVLFVQNFNAGSFAPNARQAGAFTLTLNEAGAQTAYFSDRPERIVGTLPTGKFVDGRAFDPADPPNAALVAQTDTGEDSLFIELTNPRYGADTRQLIYDARILPNGNDEWLSAVALQPKDQTIAAQFGPGSLFVDQLTCSPDGASCNSNSDCCSGFCCEDIEVCPPGVCTS